MSKKISASEGELGALHKAVTEVLLNKITSEDVSSADISNAIKFLKDNGINCDATENDDLLRIADRVPDFVKAEDFES